MTSPQPCPACDAPILVVRTSRRGGQREAFDPDPGEGPQFTVMLSADLSHVARSGEAARRLAGRVPLYRGHFWSCRERLLVPADRGLPGIDGYRHRAAG